MDNENNSNGVNNNTVVAKVANKEKSTNEREKNIYRNLETSKFRDINVSFCNI